MDLKHLVMLAFQVSIIATVFGFGLKATVEDLLYLVRRPGLLGRSLLAMFIVMPVLAVALARVFDFPRTVEIALVALAISPLPPLIPKRLAKAGGHAAYAIALMATVSVLAIAVVPLLVELLERYFGKPFAMAPSAIAQVVAMSALLPLAAGMACRALLPAVAERLEAPTALVGKLLLPLAALVLLAHSLPVIWALVGNGTIVAIAVFVVVGLTVGHLLGGPDPDGRSVLALSSACRHPAIALAIAHANFPEERFGATILLYLLLSALVGMVYTIWQRGKAADAARVT